MPERLFPFFQVELPLELGPPDGRWLLRGSIEGEAKRIVVLSTVGGRRADAGKRRGGRRRRGGDPDLEQSSVPVTRATVISPDEAFHSRGQAEAWLARIDADAETERAFSTIARLSQAHRIAFADPWPADVSPSRALALRVGFGDGEQVAQGHWLSAVELPTAAGGRRWGRRRLAMLEGHREEHLAALLGARERELICEELCLRARRDLDAGRTRLAAIELERAYAAAAVEMPRAELSELRDSVLAAAAIAMPADNASEPAHQLDAQQLRHALERLEAALRARAAARG